MAVKIITERKDMGVETGPSGAVAVAGPPPSFEAAPAVGSIKAFGPKYESLSFAPIDSPVGKGDLQNMVPYKVGMFDPTGSISFSAVKDEKASSHLRGEAELSSGVHPFGSEPQGRGLGDVAESVISEPRVDGVKLSHPRGVQRTHGRVPPVVEEANHWLGIIEPARVEPDPVIAGELQPFRYSYSDTVSLDQHSQITESNSTLDPRSSSLSLRAEGLGGDDKVGVAASPSTARQAEPLFAPVIPEQWVDETIKEEEIKAEEIKAENGIDEASDTVEEEEIEELKLKYVEHEEVSSKRKYQIGQAIEKADAEAKEEGSEEIEGNTLKRYFAPEDQSNRSGIAVPGVPDGSLQQTYEVLAARNYGSAREARETADTTVAQLKPVTKAKEGKKVKERDIARVRRDPFIKRHPVEEVVARIVKKTILAEKTGQKPIVIHEVQAESLEGTIEDLDLAKVFPKTA